MWRLLRKEKPLPRLTSSRASTCFATRHSATSRSCSRCEKLSRVRVTIGCRSSSFAMFSTSISPTPRRSARSKPRSTGAATATSSPISRNPMKSHCSSLTLSISPTRRGNTDGAPALTASFQLELIAEQCLFPAARSADHPRGTLVVLRRVVADALLDRPGEYAAGNPASPRSAACLRDVFAGPHHARLPPEPDCDPRLRLCRCAQRSCGAYPDSAARHAAVDPRAKFPSPGDGGDGFALSHTPVGRGDGRDSAHLHRAGLEHDLQRVLGVEEYPARVTGGRTDLSAHLVAALHSTGAALRRDRPGVEFDDVGGGRLVLPDGLRNVRAGQPRSASARARFLSADRRQCRRHRRDPLGRLRHGPGHCADGPDRLAPYHRVGREVQDGTGGGVADAALARSESPAAFAGHSGGVSEDRGAGPRGPHIVRRPEAPVLSPRRRQTQTAPMDWVD